MAFTEQVICPDTHIFISGILFDGADYKVLSRLVKKHINCFSHMENKNIVVLFKAHDKDFSNFLLETLKKFLENMKQSINYAKTKKFSEKEFFNYVQKTHLSGHSNGSDFYDYWKYKKNVFSSWIPLARQRIEDNIHDLIWEIHSKFTELKKYHFNLDETYVEAQHNDFSSKQEQGSITKDVQYRDLRIFASCIVYAQKYNPEKPIYFVTGDKNFEKVSKDQKSKLCVNNLVILSIDEFLKKSYQK